MRTSRLKTTIMAATVFLLAVAVRLPTIHAPFFYDDFHAVIDNPSVTGSTSIVEMFTSTSSFSAKPGSSMYRPLTIISYALNYRLSGRDPLGWHIVSLIIHGVATLFVFGIFLRLFPEKSETALAGTLLWALHPLLNEAIVYQAARSSMMAATAVVAAIYFNLSIERRLGRIVAVCLCLVLGLMSKEIAVVTFPLVILSDIGFRRNPIREWKGYVAVFAVLVAYLAFRHFILRVESFSGSTPLRSIKSNLIIQATVVVAYLAKLLWPVNQSIEWGHPEFDSLLGAGVPWYRSPAVSIVIIAALIVVGLAYIRKSPLGATGIGWFFASLIPESSFIPLVQVANERRLYLPAAGIAILGAFLVDKAAKGRATAMRVSMASILICMTALTLADASRWKSAEAQWENAVRLYPSSRPALHWLASALLDEGRLRASATAYQRLLDEYPDYAGGYTGMGRLLARLGRYENAVAYYRRAIELDGNEYIPWINLSMVYLHMGDFKLSEETAREGISLFPDIARLWNNLGAALAEQGKLREAVEAFDRALAIDPRYKIALENRSRALKELEVEE